MSTITFSVPILPGKTDTWKRALEEITGPRKSDYEKSRRRMGITREVVSLQKTPDGDYAVVCLEGDDPASAPQKYLMSEDPFDRWFAKEVLVGTHGMDASRPLPPTQLLVDWQA